MNGYVPGWMSETSEGDTIRVELPRGYISFSPTPRDGAGTVSKEDLEDMFFQSEPNINYLEIKIVRMWQPPFADQLEGMDNAFRTAIQIQQRANTVSFIGEAEGDELHFTYAVNFPCYIKAPSPDTNEQ